MGKRQRSSLKLHHQQDERQHRHGHGHGHGHGHEHEYTYTSSLRWVNALMILSCIMTADAFVVSTQNLSIRSLSTHMEHHGTSSSLNMARRRSSSPNDSDNKIKYIRIQPRNVRGNRRSFELQTAVTTLSKTTIGMDDKMRTNTIDIHSQLHFGDASYFDYYNDEEAFGSNYDYTFYELIVSDALLKTKQNEGGGGGNYQFLAPLKQPTMNTSRRIYSNAYETVNHNPIAPPPSDENTANSYGLSCQLNVIDYTKDKWIHCDATREQYQNIILKSEGNDEKKGAQSQSQEIPIWALASTATAPLQEYISALYRPSTPSTSTGTASSELSRLSSTRLFSNLFLDGNSFITFLRLLLWTFSPSPEVSILLLDWSSIVDPKPKGVGFVSPVFIPVLSSLIRGNVLEARKLVFAQLLVSGQTSGGRDLNLVRRRNSVAMEKLMNALELNEDGDYSSNNRNSGSSSLSSRSALLYGAMHCQDLQSRFEKMGYTVRNVEWRTAWSVSVPSFGSASRGRGQGSSTADVPASASVGGMSWGNFASSADPKDVGIGLVIVPMYLLVGGLDWLGTVQDIANALDQSAFVDGFAIAVFYLMRHLAMYLGLSKFVVSWDGEANLFGGSSD